MKSFDGKGHILKVVEVPGFAQDWGTTTIEGGERALVKRADARRARI